ncbi:MAG: hypothetical protein WCL30_02825 [Pseudomonadota bacterium]
MKRLISVIVVLLAFGGLYSPAIALDISPDTSYQEGYSGEVPLMVIRFNKSHVAYKKTLYYAVSKALEAKPAARFEVVGVAARRLDKEKQESANETAGQNLSKVTAALREIGVPESRITVTHGSDNISSSEVRIFVR